MEEITRIFIEYVRLWLKKIAAAFNAGKYFRCALIGLAPFAGAGAGATIFWLIIGLIWLFLKQYGTFLLFFLGTPALVIFALWYFFGQKTDVKPPIDQNNRKALRYAQQGLDTLLDYILIVAESLIEKTSVYPPKTKGQLAYPDKNRCITVANGVAIISVVLDYTGEINTTQYKDRFNTRMGQMLSAGELPGQPPALFIDMDNNPHTAIQAITCAPIKNTEHIILEVIRVNQAAVPLLDKQDRDQAVEPDDRGQLYDDAL